MCESAATPLARLSEECARCLRHQEARLSSWTRLPKIFDDAGFGTRSETSCEPCRELAFRALCDGNDAAWDLLLVHLWPLILRWLYAAQPELTPARAETLGYHGLRRFRHRCVQRADLAANFPTFPNLLAILQHCLRQVTGEGGRTAK